MNHFSPLEQGILGVIFLSIPHFYRTSFVLDMRICVKIVVRLDDECWNSSVLYTGEGIQ
jgi:hypothetical protein